MRSTALCCAVMACAAGFGYPQVLIAQAQNNVAQGPNNIIAPADRTFDFGVVARSANTEHRFTFTNPFASDLHVRSVRTSCGCTTPMVETETIPPGGQGTVLARFNTGSFTGQRSATLTVTLDKPFFTELQLNVKGYIRSDIVLSPGEASFGAIPQGEPQTKEISLAYAGRADWAITNVTSPADFIAITFEETERATGKVGYKLQVQMSENAPAGAFQNQLVVHTNDRRLTSVPIRITANIEPALQASPQLLALGKVKPAEPISQRLVVKGREPFVIEEITSDHAEIRFDNDQVAKRAFILNMIVAPFAEQGEAMAENGEVAGEIVINTSLQDEPLRVPLTFQLEVAGQMPGEIAINTID